MKKLAQFKSWSWDTRLLCILGAAATVPVIAALWTPSERRDLPGGSLDTHIPRGFVLIPIDVQNYEALDSLLGRFGLVDLFRPGENGSPERLVAVNVRLLRAPQNPSHFAVLVPEAEAHTILAHGSSFKVTLKPPGASGTEFVKPKALAKRKIIYGGA